MLISRTFAGRIADRRGRAAIIVPGVILMTISLMTLPAANGYPLFIITGSLYGLGFGAAQPATMALLIDQVGLERRGLGISTYFIGFDLGLATGATLLGMVSQYQGFGVMWPMASGLTLLSLAGLLLVRRRAPRA